MDDLNVIDRFTEVFTTYIDSGFGLLAGDVAFLTSILVAIDITLAGLFWAMDPASDIVGRLIRKVLYVGAFALLLNNWTLLSTVVFDSFAGLGLQATGSGLSADDLLRPGFIAGTGFAAAHPLLEQAGAMVGFTTLIDNLVPVLVLLFAWVVVVLAFFILAVQLFVTILEFKLTTLAGFVLVPFALWGRTAFLAERVLGNVIGAGIKMMVLAVILGIGTTFFAEFVGALDGMEPSLSQTMSLVLGAIALLGLGIFGPGIAAGLTAGAPQLGAGAAVGAAGAVAATTFAAGGAVAGVARVGMAGGAAIRAGSALPAGGGISAGEAGERRGASGLARSGHGAGTTAAQGMAAEGHSADRAEAGGLGGTAGRAGHTAAASDAGAPAWARRLRAEQRRRAHLHATGQAIKEGDRPGAGINPDLSEKE